MGVKAYYSTDSGAPAIGTAAGDLVNLLKKCLVDGYGSKAGLGWTAAFSGSYQHALIKSADAGATGLYLYVNDTTTTYATVQAWEAASGLDGAGALVGGVAQWDGTGNVVCKAAARPWVLIGDERLFYLFIQSCIYSSENYAYGGLVFGDCISVKPGDLYNCLLMADFSSNANQWSYSYTYVSYLSAYWKTGMSCHSLARPYTGVLGRASFSKISQGASYLPSGTNYRPFGPNYSSAPTYCPFPNGADNGFYVSPVTVVDSPTGTIRGYLPGMYDSPHFRPLAHKAVITGSDILPGRSLQALLLSDMGNGATASGFAYMDITGPWR